MIDAEYRQELAELALEIRRRWDAFFRDSLRWLGVETPTYPCGAGERGEIFGEFKRELERRGIRLLTRDKWREGNGMIRVVCEVWHKGQLFRTTEDEYDPFMEKYGERKPMLASWLKKKEEE